MDKSVKKGIEKFASENIKDESKREKFVKIAVKTKEDLDKLIAVSSKTKSALFGLGNDKRDAAGLQAATFLREGYSHDEIVNALSEQGLDKEEAEEIVNTNEAVFEYMYGPGGHLPDMTGPTDVV